MSGGHQIKTSKKEIINYWLNSEDYANGDECGMGIDHADIGEDGGRCWRCATTKNVQRCHIVAHSQGGADEPNNYMLLCKTCHDDAPMVSNSTAEDFFIWIKESRKAILKYLQENTENSLGLGLKLSGYPPVGARGNYWDLKVLQIAIQNWGFDIMGEKTKLVERFLDIIKAEIPNPINEDSDNYVYQIFDMMQVFNEIMHIIDETEVGVHMQQESGRLSKAKFSSEALANIKNIKNIKSLMDEKKEAFKDYVNNILTDECVLDFNESLGFDFFEERGVTYEFSS